MKIIDAHLHFGSDAYFDEIAKAAEHENSADHLLEQYRMRGMVHGIVMGNLPVEELEPVYPPFLSYCIGLDSQVFDMAKLPQKLHLIEQHLKIRAMRRSISTTTGSRPSMSWSRAIRSQSRSTRA